MSAEVRCSGAGNYGVELSWSTTMMASVSQRRSVTAAHTRSVGVAKAKAVMFYGCDLFFIIFFSFPPADKVAPHQRTAASPAAVPDSTGIIYK